MMGCATPVGEQGSNVAKAITQFAGWDDSIPAVQMDRFCASSRGGEFSGSEHHIGLELHDSRWRRGEHVSGTNGQ